MARNSQNMSRSPKQTNLLASKDIWKESGISASPGMKKELNKLKITPQQLIKTPSQVGGGRTNISDRH